MEYGSPRSRGRQHTIGLRSPNRMGQWAFLTNHDVPQSDLRVADTSPEWLDYVRAAMAQLRPFDATAREGELRFDYPSSERSTVHVGARRMGSCSKGGPVAVARPAAKTATVVRKDGRASRCSHDEILSNVRSQSRFGDQRHFVKEDTSSKNMVWRPIPTWRRQLPLEDGAAGLPASLQFSAGARVGTRAA